MKNVPQYILNLIISQEWAIDFESGIKSLNQFLFELSASDGSSKGDMAALFQEMKNRNLPQLISTEQTFTVDVYNNIPRDLPQDSILKLTLSGVMMSEDTWCSYGIRSLANLFYNAYQNPNISGILFDVNSGGGEANAGLILMNAIKDRNKPVVTTYHTLGSAALMGALHSDEIIAAGETATAGSIGTFISLDKSFVTWYKENVEDIYSDVSTEKNREFRAYVNGDTEPLRAMITKHAKLFQSEVRSARQLVGSDEKIDNTLSGGMFYATDAKNRGLIDGIGTQNYALKRLRSHINYSKK